MTKDQLFQLIKERQSYLCVGLDTDINRIPKHLLRYEDPIFEFNKQIIDATRDLCIAYKPNLAFYECNGAKGWQSLARTVQYIGRNHFKIADAKRGDIGNTSKMYARTFFENMEFDAVTVAPYMGADSVMPFLEFPNKWVILLALTSNEGSKDFQFENEAVEPLYMTVLKKSSKWSSPEAMMYVVGATHPALIESIRDLVPEHFLLVPGVGVQGGDLRAISEKGLNQHGGLIVNASRSIIYAGDGFNFAEKAHSASKALQAQMASILIKKFQ